MTQVENSSRRARRSAGQHEQAPSSARRSSAAAGSPAAGSPAGDQHDRRGSHATTYGQGFSWVLAWTIIGALIPGSGLVAAGWRRLGALLLLLVGLGLAGLAAAALLGDALKRALSLAFDTEKLLIVAAVTVAVALAWAMIILLTHTQLRRYASLSSGQRAFSGLVVLALIAAVAIPAYKVTSYSLIQRDLVNALTTDDNALSGGSAPKKHKADPWAGIPRMNVLLLGSDAGKGRSGTRPDTMIVASINTKTGNTVLFSLPRNLERAPFPIGTPGATAWPDGFYCAQDACLLNAVWQWGEQNKRLFPGTSNPGLKATAQAIQGVTGLRIDTYASLNLKGFQSFVNALGGITVNNTERLPIGGNGDPSSPRYHRAVGGWIEPGKNLHLDGFHALWFARSRWNSDDFHRMRRQRCVIGAVVSQADPKKMVQKFPALAKAAKSNIQTGIGKDDLQAWLTLALRIKDAKVTSLPFDNHVVTDRTNPDYPLIHRLVTEAIIDSGKPAVKKTTPAVTPGASASAAPTPKPTKKAADPQVAQSIKDVC